MSRAEPSIAARPGTTESSKLHRRALGVPDLMFFIIAASAPLTAVAGGQAATYLVTGNRAVAFMFIPLGMVLGVANFNVLITGLTDAPIDTMTVVLPLILFGGGIVGLKRSRPDVYERIGGGAGVEE